MVAIWTDVLQCDVGADSNFFALNGSSLAAFRIAAMLANRYDVEVEAVDVFDAETPEALCDLVTAR
jgi:acyl carrier protein